MDDEDFVNFESNHFLELAKLLYDDVNDSEYKSALERTIITRIYYAVFLFLREWMKEENYGCLLKNNGEDHSIIPDFIYNNGPCDNQTNHDIANNFKDLKRLRRQCDYFLELPSPGTDESKKWIRLSTRDAILTAEFIINNFSF